jgi:hypothetical protein
MLAEDVRAVLSSVTKFKVRAILKLSIAVIFALKINLLQYYFGVRGLSLRRLREPAFNQISMGAQGRLDRLPYLAMPGT